LVARRRRRQFQRLRLLRQFRLRLLRQLRLQPLRQLRLQPLVLRLAINQTVARSE
jgi:hypothetical protein